jgi:hypothetical protein
VVFTTPIRLPVDATADRNADLTVHASDIARDCGDNGGADPGYVPPEKDCGVRDGGFAARLYFNDPQDDDLFVPIGKKTPEKDNLKLEGSDYEWLKPGGEDGSSTLSSVYANCPWQLSSYVESAGEIWISPAKIAERKLFAAKRKKLVVSGDHIVDRAEQYTTGKTILAWNLRLKRVK